FRSEKLFDSNELAILLFLPPGYVVCINNKRRIFASKRTYIIRFALKNLGKLFCFKQRPELIVGNTLIYIVDNDIYELVLCFDVRTEFVETLLRELTARSINCVDVCHLYSPPYLS